LISTSDGNVASDFVREMAVMEWEKRGEREATNSAGGADHGYLATFL
jgi:hypothetical protein